MVVMLRAVVRGSSLALSLLRQVRWSRVGSVVVVMLRAVVRGSVAVLLFFVAAADCAGREPGWSCLESVP